MELSIIEIAFQAVVFIAMFFVLNAFVIQPWLQLEHKRQQATTLKEAEASQLMTRSQSLIDNYNQTMQETKAEAARKIQAAQQAGMQESKGILAQARQEGQQLFAEKRAELLKQQKQLDIELDKEAGNLADALVQQIL